MTPEELEAMAQSGRKDHGKCRVRVCMAASCVSAGSDQVHKRFQAKLKEADAGDVVLSPVGCMGLCSAGPLVSIEDEATPQPDEEEDSSAESASEAAPKDNGAHETLYKLVKPDDVDELYGSIASGEVVERLRCPTDVPFFTRQFKIALENSGRINPEKIEEYVAADGFRALYTALTERQPADVLTEVSRSGLRGRGGAGYPVGLKWSTVAKSPDPEKFVICNADEGDPGAFMDRSVLESDPYRVIEGMLLAAYAVGAQKGYLYVRAEYPLAIQRLRLALRQAKSKGFLGENICGSPFSLSIEIRLGAGAFVCGEETALMASIEGKRGQPRPRPPYPAESGLFGHSTLINNVETFANIPPILRRGGDWFSGIGTEKSKGTKVFALAGQIVNTGLIEVPMGMSLREIVYSIGGGVPGGGAVKAVQTGGPSGGCIPESRLDIPVDYDSLQQVGSMMGSGGMIVMDETSSMVDVARYFMEFCMSESCGKCVPCRVGTYQLHELLSRIVKRQATHSDLALLEKLCKTVRETSLCGLGQSAPNPVLSTLRYFRHEYDERLQQRKLPSLAAPPSEEGAE